MSKKVIVIGASFPSKKNHAEGVYLYNLMRYFKKTFSLQVCVPRGMFGKGTAGAETDEFEGSVKRPSYFNLGKFQFLRKIALGSYFRSIYSVCDKKADFIYSHFLFPSGYGAYRVSKKLNKPFFVALGESTTSSYETPIGKEILKNAAGLVVVSQKISDFLVANSGVNADKIIVAPNRADSYIFKPLDKIEARKRLGLPVDAKIVIFVGQFIYRKGYDRVLAALELLPERVESIFIGKGEFESTSDKILYKGTVQNKLLVDYYNAADLFVLPTLSEGSCNAIAEAIACGLPILSSDVTEIKEQVFEDSSHLVDPLSPEAIAKGIEHMYANFDNYKELALKNSVKYSLEARANTILNFINTKLK
ncbi:MAG: glycosyltransferase [Sphingobacteriaceae bacterium]|nr:MAG: glycosyltransferase [Sphingobacteriaceae bacterium]